jgi:methyl-accepting chemotaxis protein
MQSLKNVKLNIRLMLLAVIPLIVILIYSSVTIFGLYQEKNNLLEIKNRIQEAEYLANLIHPMQIERGLSVGYIASNGVKNKEKIIQIRKEVDKNRALLEKLLLATKGDIPINTLQDLANQREKIDTLALTAPQTGSYFSKNIVTLLDSLPAIVSTIMVMENRNEVQAYTHLATVKESLGQIRANLNGAFTNNQFAGDTFGTFSSSIGIYTINLHKFLVTASKETKEFHQTTYSGKVVDDTFLMIEKAKTHFATGQFGVEPTIWFSNVTASLELLRKVELYIFENLHNSVDENISSTTKKIWLLIFFIGGFIVVALIGTITMIKDISHNLKSFQEGLEEFFKYLQRETPTAKIITLENQNDFGIMAAMVNENIKKIEQGLQKDNQMVQETLQGVEKVKQGFLDVTIIATPNNPQLLELKNGINEMTKEFKINIDKIQSVLGEFALYKFTSKINNTTLRGDMAQLIENVNFLTDEISALLAQNLQDGDTLNKSTETLLENVEILNQSANNSAASLEETAAALEEITQTVMSNSSNVIEMSNLSQSVSLSAKKGQQLAKNTTQAMDNITQQVQNINNAIAVIDQIAFQTNILSLNAAVEAATAGEAGKGFAVVAGEVRNLATRSSDAAKEIKDIVSNAISKANEGKNISTNMIFGYEELLGNIEQTTGLIRQIATASKEQEAGIRQINDTVATLDKQTQQNASIAELVRNISIEADGLSKRMMEDANSKEFLGKNIR